MSMRKLAFDEIEVCDVHKALQGFYFPPSALGVEFERKKKRKLAVLNSATNEFAS